MHFLLLIVYRRIFTCKFLMEGFKMLICLWIRNIQTSREMNKRVTTFFNFQLQYFHQESAAITSTIELVITMSKMGPWEERRKFLTYGNILKTLKVRPPKYYRKHFTTWDRIVPEKNRAHRAHAHQP